MGTHYWFAFPFSSHTTAIPVAHGSSWARGQIGAAAVSLHHSHCQHWVQAASCSNARSVTHWVTLGIKSPSSWTLCLGLTLLSHNWELIIARWYFLSFILSMWYISHSFVDTEPSWHPWTKFHLIVVYGLFKCIVEFSLLMLCWGFLHLCLSGILACNFLFLPVIFYSCGVLVWFWYKGNAVF